MWGGFIDFPNAPHATPFAASITTDNGASLDTTLTRP
jgi:hypothetical protein